MDTAPVTDAVPRTHALSGQLPRRRPSGAPPPLPHHLRTTGLGWLIALVAVVGATLIVFHNGLHGVAIPATVIDDTIVRWVSSADAPGLHKAARMVAAVSSWWTIQILSTVLPLALLALRRWRHLLITEVLVQLTQMVSRVIRDVSVRPRPFGVPLRGGWGGWALPSDQMLATSGLLVIVLYTLVPEGRLRNVGKWVVAGIVSVVALARLHLGIDAPTDIAVGVTLAVAFTVVAFRAFAPNDYFPVTYRRGRVAHLDVEGERGVAIRQAVEEQLGLVVTDIAPVGLSGSAGSTPLRLRVDGIPDEYVFGKLYSKAHLRSDRWYKLGRELLYGRLEDEKPFNAVRRLVQQEDYALRLVRDAGVPSATPYGIVELTPEREYLLVTEFFDGAMELGEAEVDDGVIDEGLRVIRLLWNAGIAHRDVKPANLMVRDGTILVIDVAFAEVRPTPWRQAVDLANMMLCLALRSDPQHVYDRALRQFSVDEITEAFAAARGLALPSQLRRAMRAEGRDVHEEFLRLLPERPRPIGVQRWTPRRVLIWAALLLVVAVIAVNFASLFSSREVTTSPLNTSRIDCAATEDYEPLWIEAQSVQSAPLVPCVASLPPGWSFRNGYANSGRSGFTVDHDRAGPAALDVRLTRRCDVRGTTELPPDVDGARRFGASRTSGYALDKVWYEVFDSGCTTTRLRSHSAAPEVNAEVDRQGATIVGYVPRSTLARALAARTNGRLHLDPR